MEYLFFDKEGNNLNLKKEKNETFKRGNIFFSSTSVHIPAVEHIYILNENYEIVNVKIEFLKNIIFKSFSRNKEKIIDDVYNFYGQINIYAENENNEVSNDTIIIYNENNIKIAEIELECEFIEEEERFDILLKNLYNPDLLPNKDVYYAFRNSNIKEYNINYKILNTKRKELLMLGYEIFPFIGADKALVNMITYLGYDDIDIKEIWRNVDDKSINYNKIKYIQNKYQLHKKDKKVNHQLTHSTEWKKTNKFGLFFKYNKIVENEYDEYGLPLIINNFDYTIEETLLKFTKVTEYLNNKFLPLNVKLHSITGEGLYFEKIGINVFNENTYISNVTLDLTPEIIINDKKDIYYIEDLRKYDDTYYQTYEIDRTKNISLYSNKLVGLTESSIAHEVFNENPMAPIGARINLEIGGLFEQIKDLNFNFQSIIDAFPNATWDNIKFGNNYECEWILKNIDTGYTYRNRGFIANNYKHVAIIPYIGIYDLELIVWNLDNVKNIKRIPKAIEVKMYEPLFNYFYPRTTQLEQLKLFTQFKLNNIYGQLNNLFITPLKIKDFNVKLNTFNANNFLHNELYRQNSADIIDIDRNNNLIKLSNINGNTQKLKNVKILGKSKNEYNIKEIKFLASTNVLLFQDNLDIIINAIKNTIGLEVPLYELNPILHWDSKILRSNFYILYVNEIEYLTRIKIETLTKSKYLYAENIQKLENKEFNYYIEITKDLYDMLQEDTVNLYNINNFYYTEINGYDAIEKKIKFKNSDWKLYTNNNYTVNSEYDSEYNSEYNSEYDSKYDSEYDSESNTIQNSIICFDIFSDKNEYTIFTNSFNNETNTLYLNNINTYNMLSTNTKLYWNNFDIDIIDTLDNSEFKIENYINRKENINWFILSALNFENTFFSINDDQYEITNLENYSVETVTKFLNDLNLLFYFIINPDNKNTILGIKKIYNDNTIYEIITYNGLKINKENSLILKPNNDNNLNFNKIKIFKNSSTIEKNKLIFFTLDETKIKGLNYSKISIYKDNLLIFETERKNFTYKFNENGYYNININVVDNMKNTKIKQLNNFLYVK